MVLQGVDLKQSTEAEVVNSEAKYLLDYCMEYAIQLTTLQSSGSDEFLKYSQPRHLRKWDGSLGPRHVYEKQEWEQWNLSQFYNLSLLCPECAWPLNWLPCFQ